MMHIAIQDLESQMKRYEVFSGDCPHCRGTMLEPESQTKTCLECNGKGSLEQATDNLLKAALKKHTDLRAFAKMLLIAKANSTVVNVFTGSRLYPKVDDKAQGEG